MEQLNSGCALLRRFLLMAACACAVGALFAAAMAVYMAAQSDGIRFFHAKRPMPTFYDAALTRRAPQVLMPGMEYEVIERVRVPLDTAFLTPYKHIVRKTEACRIAIGEDSLWFSENLCLQPYEKPGVFRMTPVFGSCAAFAAPLFAFLAMALTLARRALALPIDSAARAGCAILAYMCLWLAGACAMFYTSGFFIVFSTGDADQFAAIAREWFAGARHTPIPSNVGTAFLYMPVMLATGGTCFMDVAIPISSLTLLGGACAFGLGLAAARRLCGTPTAMHVAAVAGFVFAVFAAVMRQGGVWDPAFRGATLLRPLLDHSPYAHALYNKALLLGWNGVSDTHALLLELAALAAGAVLRPSAWRTAAMGLAMGLAFTTRYGSVSFLPTILILHAIPYMESKADWRGFVRLNLLFGATWAAGAFPQLCDNFVVHGDFFQTTAVPGLYHGGNTVVHLFGLSNLFNGLHFFSQVHFKLLTAFALCLYALRPPRLGLFLWCCVCGPLVFHSLLNFYGHSELRYILVIFPSIALAFGAVATRPSAGGLAPLVLYAALSIVCMATASPECAFYQTTSDSFISRLAGACGLPPPPAWAGHAIPPLCGLLALLGAWAMRAPMRGAYGFAFAMALIATGDWRVPIALLAFYPLYAAAQPFANRIPIATIIGAGSVPLKTTLKRGA